MNFQIPKGWKRVKVGEYVVSVKGKKPKRISSIKTKEFSIPYVNIKAFEKNIIDEYTDGIGCTLCEDGDFLMVWDGSRSGYVGKAIAGALGSTLVKLNFPDIYNNYAYYFLQSKFLDINTKAKGVGIPHVDPNILWNYDLLIPPIDNQQAIVSKIEELFSELDKGVENLRLAQEQLKVYRQSVLKWAFEGRLTNVEVTEGVLPEGWEWLTMNDVCNKIGDIDHKMPKQLSSGYPYVSTKDFTHDLKISFDKAKYISKEDYLNLSRKIRPERGDIIFPRYGTIGKNILIDFDKEFLVSYSCAVVKPNSKLVLSKYLYLYSLSPKITDEIRKYVVETTQANIGIASIKSFVFPLPTIEEQNKIVQEIESRLSVADKMEENIIQSMQQAEALRQSILKKAFEGKLLPTETVVAIKPKAKIIPFERKVLAGKLIHLLHKEKYFGLTKFQKLFYLVENFCEVEYETNFIQETAGPYDRNFTVGFRKEMKDKNWFEEEQKASITRFIPGENVGSLIKDYSKYFRSKSPKIVFIIEQLKDKSTHESELIATLYAVWNNRLLSNKSVKINLLVEDFFNWSPKKIEEFQEEEIVNAFKWMKKLKLIPTGFGKRI
ncbi:restriction endonuclease subunit S [Ferruginibacter sp. HRS2-29]|uniref:restriction endonuclease subunit S n=1 Tax=Ferruginibacter sp. HRS2-29 TaxID=2487334 RepID=UPI0020CB856B|nr:restriction endonuclease subunit S [Ferruginibacter sp. HRS2-29]